MFRDTVRALLVWKLGNETKQIDAHSEDLKVGLRCSDS